MNRYKLFIILSVTIICVSCSKDDKHEYPFPNDGLKVKTITEGILAPNGDQFQHIYNYSYDSAGRVKAIYTDSSYTVFKYTGSFTEKDIYPITGPAQHYYYYYNDDDRLDSTVWFEELSIDTTHMVYKYNANGMVDKREDKIISSPGVLKDKSLSVYKYDSRGNLSEINGATILRNFFSDSANYHDISEQVSPDAIMNPNLLDSSSASISAGNPSDPGGNSYYRYTIDNFGRLEEMRVEQIVVGLKIRRLLTYTYY